MEIKTTDEISNLFEDEYTECAELSDDPYNNVDFKNKINVKWVRIDSLMSELNHVMNVRNDEKNMRLLIIEIQKELQR